MKLFGLVLAQAGFTVAKGSFQKYSILPTDFGDNFGRFCISINDTDTVTLVTL